MKFLILVVSLAAFTSAHSGHPKLVPYVVNPGGIGGIYKGPDSATIIKGPDGSVVKSQQIGGAVEVADVHPIHSAVLKSGLVVDDLGIGHAGRVGHSGLVHAGPIRTGSVPLAAGLGAYGAPRVVNPLIYDDLNVDIVQATPVRGVSAGAIHAGPVSTGSIHAAPVSAGAIHAGPVSAGSIHAAPVSAGSIHAGPVLPGAISTGPILPGHIHSGPIPVGPIHAAPLSPVSLEAGLLSPGSIHAGPLHAPVLTGAVHSLSLPVTHPVVAPGIVHSAPVSAGSVVVGPSTAGAVVAGPTSSGAVLTGASKVAVVNPILPAVAPIASPVILNDAPIIVDDVLIGKDPKIVEEHVIVGNKVITVPKKLEEDIDLVGPSGTISTRGGDAVIAGPASTTIQGGGVVSDVQKQPNIHVKTVEVKPLVSHTPVVLQPKPILPLVKAYAPHAPILDPIHPIVGPTVLNTGRLPLPLAHAPIVDGLHPIIGPTVVKTGPVPLPLSAVNVVPAYAPGFVKYPHY